MTTYKIEKVEGLIYWDWNLIDNKAYIYQEKVDGRVNNTFICDSPTDSIQEFAEEYIEEFSEDDNFIYFEIKNL